MVYRHIWTLAALLIAMHMDAGTGVHYGVTATPAL